VKPASCAISSEQSACPQGRRSVGVSPIMALQRAGKGVWLFADRAFCFPPVPAHHARYLKYKGAA
jgi:hypothetical protein